MAFFDLPDEPIAESIVIDRTHILSEKLEPFEEFTDQELYEAIGDTLIFDIECYVNYFLIMFKSLTSKKVVYFELSADSTICYEKLDWIMWRFLTIGFNSIGYDLPMLYLCLKGLSCAELKRVSDRIIIEELRAYQIEREFNIKIPDQINHIDLIEVAPLTAGLKTYAGRLHCQKMQDLPFEPAQVLTQEEALHVRHYCINDLDNTGLLYDKLKEQIKLRETMSAEYGVDLRSKSDAQIAETVLVSEVAKATGHRPKRPFFVSGQTMRYKLPDFLHYQTKKMNDILNTVLGIDFIVEDSGYLSYPKDYNIVDNCADYLISNKGKKKIGLIVEMGQSAYSLALGGLHSREESKSYVSDSNFQLSDFDAASFYPMISINQGLFPKQMGPIYVKVYKGIVDRRLEAKARKIKVIANSLKIVINSSFGKLGSKHSTLFAPDLLLQVTISGQLILLMLIERIELAGISVVSANTDGIVMYCPQEKMEELHEIIAQFEKDTNFSMEETRYIALYSHNVNNYIAIKENDECKGKGDFAIEEEMRLHHNPSAEICTLAIMSFLVGKIPIEQTIRECQDMTKFLSVLNVKGGAHQRGKYLGKVVRFYYSTEEKGCIQYVTSGNKVQKSDGARPMMNLAPIPDDLDYSWYIKACEKMLYEIGYYKPKRKGLF